MSARIIFFVGLLLAVATFGAWAASPPAAARPSARSVFVPYDEYARLESQARSPTASRSGSHLTSAAFTARLEGAGVRLLGRFHFRCPPSAPAGDIPLLTARAAVLAFESGPGGPRVSARLTENGTPRFFLAAAHLPEGDVTVEWRLTDPRPDRSFLMIPPLAVTCSLDLELPSTAVAASVEPALSVTRRPARPGSLAVLHAELASVGIRASWGPVNQTQERDLEAKPAVTVLRQSTRYTPAALGWNGASRFELEITGSPLASLAFRVPRAECSVSRVSLGEIQSDPRGGVVTVTFPEPLLGREQLSLEFRDSGDPADGSFVLAPPYPLNSGRPREAWLALQSAEPIEVAPRDAASPAFVLVGPADVPSDLIPPRGLTTRLAARCLSPDAQLPLRVTKWMTRGTGGQPVAEMHEYAATTTVSDRRAETQCRLSVASLQNCTISLEMTGGTSAALGSVVIDGRPAQPTASAAGRGQQLALKRGAGGLSYPVKFVHTEELVGPLGLFGSVTLRLPEPSALVRSTSWRLVLPRECLVTSVSGGFEGQPPRVRPMPYRFGAEVAEILLSAAVWLGFPVLTIAAFVLGLRKTPIGEAAVPAAAGLGALAVLALVISGLYALTAPLVRGLGSVRAADLAGLRSPEQETASQLGSSDAAGRPESVSLASAGSTRGAADEGTATRGGWSSAEPMPRPGIVAGSYPRPGLPEPHGAGLAADAVATSPVVEGILLTRGIYSPMSTGMEGSATQTAATTISTNKVAASAEIARPQLVVVLSYVQKPIVPVLQGLTVIFGFVLFLVSALFWTEPGRRAANGSFFALGFLALTGVESVMPPGLSFGAAAFSAPLTVLAIYQAVRWLLSPRLREELGRTLSQATAFGMTSSTEVPIGDLFPDSDGIDFVAEKPPGSGAKAD